MEYKETSTYNFGGREYPITGHVETKAFGTLPIVGIKMMSDYTWMKGCLESRLKNPELYAEHEDVDAVIATLRKWLAEHSAS